MYFIILRGGGSAPFPDPPPSFFGIKFYFRNIKLYNANQCVPRRQKKINTKVNERPLENIGTHWNIRHR